MDNFVSYENATAIMNGIATKLQGSKQASSTGGTIKIPDYGMTENIQMYFKPSQDLHGYSKPWAGGAGKNKLVYPYVNSSQTVSGVTFTMQDDGTVNINGTATATISFILADKVVLDNIGSGDFILNGCAQGGATDGSTYFLGFYAPGKSKYDFGSGTTISLSGNEDASSNVYIRINNGYTADNLVFKPMIRLGTETDSTFEPYANICPIVGQNNATFSWGSNNELVMNFGNTYYGGFCNFNGQMFSEWDYIASYNGETLSGEWMSDRDKYVSGTTPTTGAEVVYKTTATYVKVTPPANLNLTHAYPIEYNGYMATIIYQPRGTVLEEAKKYTNRKIGQLVPQAYSTSEEKVGTWIDGKPIYQSTIECGLLWSSMTKTITTEIVIDKIISMQGIASTPTNTIPLPYHGKEINDGAISLNLYKGNNNRLSIGITTFSDRTSYTGYVTVQYTKPSN